MLTYNEIRERKYILLSGEPYEVLSSQVSRKQQRKPVNQTKLRHLIQGNVIEQTFQSADTVPEADVSKRSVTYAYTKPDKTGSGGDEYWFTEPDNPKERFTIPHSVVAPSLSYLREGDVVDALIFTNQEDEEQIIGLSVPIKVELKVTQAPPNVKGNTAQGGNKPVTTETGLVVNTPMFIEEGDVIRVNTQTGEYVERVTN